MNRIKTVLAVVAIAALVFTTAANAAIITTSTVAPTVDGADEANLVVGTGSLKWFSDVEHDAGQTFTPGADARLTSFTIQLNARNDNDNNPNEWVNVRIGTISRPGGVFTFTDTYAESAYLTTDWLANDYITFTFTSPQMLTSGIEYGVIADSQNFGSWSSGGIPYIKTAGGYVGGNAIGRGNSRSDDLVFHANLVTPVPEPGSFALAALGLLGLIGFGLRRRR